MVVVLAAAPAPVARLGEAVRVCSSAPPAVFGRSVAVPCRLEPGHQGYHETYVRVARANGTLAGYRYSWLG